MAFTREKSGFTLVELLVVIAIISILMGLVLPALQQAKGRAQRIQCVSNLRQVGIGFHVFMHDHDSKFPMQVSTNDGGTLEFIYASYAVASRFYFQYHHFQALSNELARSSLLVCPTDHDRFAAADFPSLSDYNISYFIGANAEFAQPNSILAGDRNVTNSSVGDVTILRLNDATFAHWTEELHILKGNVLYADGRVAQLDSVAWKLAAYNSPSILDLILPSVKKPDTNNSPSPATPAHYDPPPGFPPPPRPGRRQLAAIQASSAQSGGPAPNRSPAGSSASSAPSQTTFVVPSTPQNPPPPEPPPKPIVKRILQKTNAVIPPPVEEPAPIILAQTPDKIVSQNTHWLWWLMLLLALLIGMAIGRRFNGKKSAASQINRR